jgi:hypothetical protein
MQDIRNTSNRQHEHRPRSALECHLLESPYRETAGSLIAEGKLQISLNGMPQQVCFKDAFHHQLSPER